MSRSGVSVSSVGVEAFNKLKIGKETNYIIYKLSDDNKEIVVEHTAKGTWDGFCELLFDSQSKDKAGKVGKGPRYAVYDFEYTTEDSHRTKIIFIAWSPDEAGIQPKMIYASSKEALKRSLNGIGPEIQANEANDLDHDKVVKKVLTGF